MESYKVSANEFLRISSEFHLGNLPTESQNVKTEGLSELSKNDLLKAISIIKSIDEDVFQIIRNKKSEIYELKKSIKKVIESDGRIFLVGCGATGRLSLALETLWRIKHQKKQSLSEKVISFMAGGDVALIHSVEKFEDYPDFGVRQMMELGFNSKDLLIATTEGGETPFVIGATNKAASFSEHAPYFLYCNPDDVLIKTTQRSKEVIQNNNIKKINLTVGPMALTGSTRMQATTILMYVVGLALLNFDVDDSVIENEIDQIISLIEMENFDFLAPFVEREAAIYQKNEYVYYETDGDLGISILTDTTERSPTFSLFPFENILDPEKLPSLAYLLFPNCQNSHEAWNELLKRAPRAFYWEEVTDRTTIERLYGFNFSNELVLERKKYLNVPHHNFKIYFDHEKNNINFEFDGLNKILNLRSLSFLSAHLVLKIILNNHSTLLMGRLNRYQSNLMTWVRASNYKLIDRSVRYAIILLKEKKIEVSYEQMVYACFKYKDQIARDEALVLKMVQEFSPN